MRKIDSANIVTDMSLIIHRASYVSRRVLHFSLLFMAFS